MRRAALRHPKTLAVAALLGVPRTHALGILEVLFDWAADMAPQGNIGKWPNIVLAGAVEWSGDADQLVSALTEAGYLRADPTHRLVINDWHEHCENWVRSKLKAANLPFLTIKEEVKEPVKEPVKGGLSPPDDPTHPLPSLPLPSPSIPSAASFAEFWKAYPKKVAKGAAERAWPKAREHAVAILADLASRRWDDPKFIPHPATYLNARRWEDERPATATAASPADLDAVARREAAQDAADRERLKREGLLDAPPTPHRSLEAVLGSVVQAVKR